MLKLKQQDTTLGLALRFFSSRFDHRKMGDRRTYWNSKHNIHLHSQDSFLCKIDPNLRKNSGSQKKVAMCTSRAKLILAGFKARTAKFPSSSEAHFARRGLENLLISSQSRSYRWYLGRLSPNTLYCKEAHRKKQAPFLDDDFRNYWLTKNVFIFFHNWITSINFWWEF